MFLRYFEQHGHKIVRSSSLVPANDPTLLFTNAGMNQFKDVFLGIEKRDYARATSSQKCVRAGGKHNDLENVGFTNRHHTFFEMLGNFSFGDYFKKDAIAFAWELVTSPEWFGIPKDKLFATIFKGENGIARDDEAYQHWVALLKKDGIPPDRIHEMGMKDNFWMMGDTGPCGPAARSITTWAPRPATPDTPTASSAASAAATSKSGTWCSCSSTSSPTATMRPLPKPSIDTGAGLERVTAVMQGVISNYETDLFTPLILRAAELMGKTALAHLAETVSTQGTIAHASSLAKAQVAGSLRRAVGTASVIADHSRAATFLINDGVLPSNEGRGYVLRKIIRRAIRHGRLHGQEKPFLFEMVFAVRDLMKDAYPDLVESADRVSKVIKAEEKQFDRVLRIGFERLEEGLEELKAELDWPARQSVPLALMGLTKSFPRVHELIQEAIDKRISLVGDEFRSRLEAIIGSDAMRDYDREIQLGQSTRWVEFPGDRAFSLYETYGLPLDFMVDAARDAGIGFDMEGFERAAPKSRPVLAPPGRAGRRPLPVRCTSRFPAPSSKAIARRFLPAAKCWPSSSHTMAPASVRRS